MSAPVTLPTYYLRQVIEYVEQTGVATTPWLQHSGLTPQRLSEPVLTLPFSEFHQWLHEAVLLVGDPAVGLLIGSRLQAGTHGVLSYAAMSGGSIRQVVDLLEKFIGLRENLIAISLHERGDDVEVRFTENFPLDDVRRPVLEVVIVAVRNLLDFVTLGGSNMRYVAFPFAAEGSEELAHSLLGCPVRYEQDWAGFVLPLNIIDKPLRMADPAAFQEAARLCAEDLDKRHGSETLAARVRRLMLQGQSDFPTLEFTARVFHMTPRTLHRRLEDEGLTFRVIQEEVRHALAVQHLKAGKLSIQEIAYALGYTEIANFRRAFKRWEGVPPSAYLKE